jgi:beta-lactam-binding protein with PASTA domain
MHHSKPKKILLWTANVALAALLFFLACLYALDRLDSYTRHGHHVLVPDLRGLLPADARAIAGESELDILVIDSTHAAGARPGTVIDQFPLPDARVKNNRVIQLTINAREPETILFPELNQPSFRQALQRLKNLRLRPGKIEYIPSPYANLVLGFRAGGMPVEAGTRLPVGSAVDILLGSGEGEPAGAIVPRVTGKNLDEARDMLLHAYLNVDRVNADASVKSEEDVAAAFVYEQRPGAGYLTRAGRAVTLFITRDPARIPATDDLHADEMDEWEDHE